jgi:hypothetical protein
MDNEKTLHLFVDDDYRHVEDFSVHFNYSDSDYDIAK